MLFLLMFLLGMSLVDSLNPFSIAVHIFLLGILKNTNRIAFYVLGILVVYFLGGIVIFTGLTTVFDKLAEQFATIPEFVLFGLESIFGVILIVYGLIEFRKGSKSRQSLESKDVSTWALILLGAGGTLSDLPTAIPYIGFIAKMTEMRIDILIGCSLLLIYNVIYILPLLIIWALYLAYKDNLRNRMESITVKIEKANKYITIIFCEVVGFLFIIDSVLYYIGFPIQW
jgi:cytochrome c biogenesis protein CcdA